MILIGLLGFLVVIRWDTPYFYVSQGKDELAMGVLRKIYHIEGNDEDNYSEVKKIVRFIED